MVRTVHKNPNTVKLYAEASNVCSYVEFAVYAAYPTPSHLVIRDEPDADFEPLSSLAVALHVGCAQPRARGGGRAQGRRQVVRFDLLPRRRPMDSHMPVYLISGVRKSDFSVFLEMY